MNALTTIFQRGKGAVRRLLRHAQSGSAFNAHPVNLGVRDASPAALSDDVDYGMQIIRGFEIWTKNASFDLKGKRALELGPGINLAGSLGLKALGAAEVLAADRWLPPWQADYNPLFCKMMADRIRAEEGGWDASVFERAAAGGYAGLVQLVASPAEKLNGAGFQPVDAVFSNAVLEHMSDHAATTRALAGITRPGGIGFHQVDFRYHGDFSRPLDHLLASASEHLARAKATSHEIGCQLRPGELLSLFEAAGFTVEMHPGEEAPPAYLEEFLPALRKSRSPYRGAPVDALKPVGAFYIVRRR